MERYLDTSDFWQNTLGLGGGAILGVMGTRTLDNLAAGRVHPLVLFAGKAALALGAGAALNQAGYPRLGAGLAFAAFADGTITYADQIQYRYLPGAPSAPTLPQ